MSRKPSDKSADQLKSGEDRELTSGVSSNKNEII